LRSQGVTPHCGSTPRVSSNGLSTSATKFAEPSSDRPMQFHPSLEQRLPSTAIPSPPCRPFGTLPTWRQHPVVTNCSPGITVRWFSSTMCVVSSP